MSSASDLLGAEKQKTAVVYVHGKGGNADEAAHYAPLFRNCDVIGFAYKSKTPQQAKAEFPPFFASLSKQYGAIILIANSIGAFFSMHALAETRLEKAFLISPVVDLEALMLRMLAWSGRTEEDLRRQKEIATDFGETLSWDDLCYVRENPIAFSAPTEILYGETDNLTPYAEIAAFAEQIGAGLTVMIGGEHWFHTPQQLAFLDAWLLQKGGGEL